MYGKFINLCPFLITHGDCQKQGKPGIDFISTVNLISSTEKLKLLWFRWYYIVQAVENNSCFIGDFRRCDAHVTSL